MKKNLLLITALFLTNFSNAQCWRELSSTLNHTIAIQNDGTLWTWGENAKGQLGNGTQFPKLIPTQVGTASNWKTVSAGYFHSIAIKTDGTLWAWGDNTHGELGNGTNLFSLVPIQIGTDTNWKLVTAGGSESSSSYTIATKTDGTVWSWGSNTLGQLGDGTYIDKDTPTLISGVNNVKSIAAGSNHNVVIKTDGTLWAWGVNFSGELGDGTFSGKDTPIQIGTDTNWKSISSISEHNVALKTNGTLWTWGTNQNGQLGNGDPELNSLTVPTQIGTDTNWEIASASHEITMAKKTNGTYWFTGANYVGEYGNGTIFSENNTFIQSNTGLTNSKYLITSGTGAVFSIANDGSLFAWGFNGQGQLGINSTETSLTPVRINCNALEVEEISRDTNPFVMYPNPTYGTLNFKNDINETIDKVIVSDISGKIVFEQSKNIVQINLEQLNQGIYIIQIISGKKSYQDKFIKL
jgi:alpha-tubulin suppressor-like RCC1 family protein